MDIFFDVDGVLIDGWHSKPEFRKPWNVDLEADLGVDLAAFQRGMFAPRGDAPALMTDCVAGRLALPEALAEVLPHTGYRGTIDEFIDYWLEKDANVAAPVFEVVQQLRQKTEVRLFVATGQEHIRARHLWNTLGFDKHFERMFYSAEVGRLKTDPAFYEHIDSAVTLTRPPTLRDAESPLFFDDSESALAAARSVGWDCVQFDTVADLASHPRIKAALAA